MKRFRSHKAVEAAPIATWEDDGSYLVTMEGETFDLPDNFFARGTPHPGDYLVRYEDGYLSWSPKAAFEAGYTEIAREGDEVQVAVPNVTAAQMRALQEITMDEFKGELKRLIDKTLVTGTLDRSEIAEALEAAFLMLDKGDDVEWSATPARAE